jgi:hypothetical protein
MSDQTATAPSTITDTMNDFSSPASVETTDKSFLDSNGIIAKISFLIMVAIIFVILFFIIVKLIGFFTTTPQNPLLLNGQINASTKEIVIPQNPKNQSTALITRSNNRESGIEFTWCVWVNFVGGDKSDGKATSKYRPVFVKGDCSISNPSDYCSINNGPGVYFGRASDDKSNTLFILMDTATDQASTNQNIPIITVPNIPLNNYFLLAIRCQNTYIDVYINGTIVKSQNLFNVPKQNYYDVHIAPSGGFPGSISNLQYFNKALSVVEINTMFQSGPNMKDITTASYSKPGMNTISTAWYNSFL